ncbi:MAG: hypothetical protein ABEJ44_02280 [Halanaeroarchaeum sp.]
MDERVPPDDLSRLYGETWAFESIVGAIPGVEVSDRRALLVQFALFEAIVVAVSVAFGRPGALLPGTAAVVVATAGSAFMLDIGRRVRAADLPRAYRQLLFSTSIEVVLGVVGYAVVLTVVFVYQPRQGPTLLESVLGPTVPMLPAFLFFVVLWDIAYRVGTGWWIALLALWRSMRWDVGDRAASDVRAIDRRNAVFGTVQLVLLPFVLEHRLLAVLLVGHVLAVLGVLAVARVKTEFTAT